MGNQDEILSAISNYGSNKVIKFGGGYFSFAFGNEIALVVSEKSGRYFILNCGERVFSEISKLVESGSQKNDLIKFWIEKSKILEVNDWSDDFSDLLD